MRTNNNYAPLISIVIPVFNGQTHLRETIESVLKQDYQNRELIIVDDGSTDGTSAILDQYRERAKIIRQKNSGPGAARNHGVRHCTGELIAFLDADDLWPADNLSRHVETFQSKPHMEAVLGQVQCLRAIKHAHAYGAQGTTTPNSYDNHELSVPFYSYLFGATVVKTQVFQTVGFIDEQHKMGEDVDWFLRLRESRTNLIQTAHIALHYRRHDASLTSINKENSVLRVLKESLDRRRGASGKDLKAPPIPPTVLSTQEGASR